MDDRELEERLKRLGEGRLRPEARESIWRAVEHKHEELYGSPRSERIPAQRIPWIHRWAPSSPRLRRAGWPAAIAAMLLMAVMFYAYQRLPREIVVSPSLAVKSSSSSKINLAWGPASNHVKNYILERSVDGTHFSTVASLSGEQESYTDTELKPTTSYVYRIQALNASGSPAISNAIRARTLSPFTLTVSMRGHVGTGQDVLVAGFVIGGDEPKKLLIRGLGPSLADVGHTDLLANPLARLYSGQTMIARNDDWQTTDPLGEQKGYRCGNVAEIKATGNPPAGSGHQRESALLITLPPGTYTVHVSGADGGTGLGMIEVLEIN